MQSNIVVDVEQLKRNVQALPGAVPDLIVQRGLIAAARVAAKDAKQKGKYFNDRTGAARKSIRAGSASRNVRRGANKGKRLYYASLKIGKAGAKHGSLLELGTKDMKARAPIRQAMHETLPQAWRAAAAAMKKAMDKLDMDLKSGKVAKTFVRAALKSNVSGKQRYFNKTSRGFF